MFAYLSIFFFSYCCNLRFTSWIFLNSSYFRLYYSDFFLFCSFLFSSSTFFLYYVMRAIFSSVTLGVTSFLVDDTLLLTDAIFVFYRSLSIDFKSYTIFIGSFLLFLPLGIFIDTYSLTLIFYWGGEEFYFYSSDSSGLVMTDWRNRESTGTIPFLTLRDFLERSLLKFAELSFLCKFCFDEMIGRLLLFEGGVFLLIDYIWIN